MNNIQFKYLRYFLFDVDQFETQNNIFISTSFYKINMSS